MSDDKNSSDESSDCEGDFVSDSYDQFDPTNITPYDFEPEISAEDSSDTESDSDDACSDDVNAERIGHTSWCTCTRCRAMNTIQEILCYKEYVPGSILGDNKCITEH